jgi:hypothetical protein
MLALWWNMLSGPRSPYRHWAQSEEIANRPASANYGDRSSLSATSGFSRPSAKDRLTVIKTSGRTSSKLWSGTARGLAWQSGR